MWCKMYTKNEAFVLKADNIKFKGKSTRAQKSPNFFHIFFRPSWILVVGFHLIENRIVDRIIEKRYEDSLSK